MWGATFQTPPPQRALRAPCFVRWFYVWSLMNPGMLTPPLMEHRAAPPLVHYPKRDHWMPYPKRVTVFHTQLWAVKMRLKSGDEDEMHTYTLNMCTSFLAYFAKFRPPPWCCSPRFPTNLQPACSPFFSFNSSFLFHPSPFGSVLDSWSFSF